jgi:peptidoglycan/LPS O-acetylase OafA/YrhL
MQRQSAARLPHSPGLDGLRALAIAGVFLYHANVGWATGGFLGVDLFFVLSGYLITSLLLSERARTGRIDLGAFWARRARRLLPAMLVVVVFALVATATFARDDFARTRADALSALVYLTNWRQIIASHSYFNQFGRPSLLQHFWSLAVEEQFYLFWPLMLIAGLRWLRRGRTIAATAVLAGCSFGLMWLLYNPAGDPSRVYYGTDTRAFTLLIGALLAFAWPLGGQRADVPRVAARLLDALGVATLLGVLCLFWRVHDYDPWVYRGGFLVMALCTAGLVAAVVHPATAIGRVLGRDPLRWIGVRSYGMYLWHWPIMQLTRPGIDVPMHGPLLILAQAAATVAVAALSYHYVETPVRSGAAGRWLRARLDALAPRERLGWVLGAAGTVTVAVGVCLAAPAPGSVAAVRSNATSAARDHLVAARNLPSPGGPGGDPVGPVGSVMRGDASAPWAYNAVTSTRRARKPPLLPPGRILAVGDSVMLGSAPDLEKRLGHRLTVDAVVGRQAEDTIDRLAQYRAAGQLPKTVVVQIGNNGPVWYSDMQHLRKVLASVPRVVLVNVRLARSWQNEVNNELSQYARTWPQAVIANWFAHSTQAMLTDGVHPSVAAQENYVDVIIAALEQVERKSASTKA